MPDLNKNMIEIQDKTIRMKKEIRDLLMQWDGLFREVNTVYMGEKLSSSSTEGLEDFYRCVQTIRRNRDVLGSLVKGFNNIRSLDKFKFVEEDTPKETAPKKAKEKAVEEAIYQDMVMQPDEESINV